MQNVKQNLKEPRLHCKNMFLKWEKIAMGESAGMEFVRADLNTTPEESPGPWDRVLGFS